MNAKTLTLITISSTALAICSNAAVTLTTADGAGADTYLTNDGNSGSTVAHGAEGSMEIRHLTDTRLRILYIRFDLTGVSGDLSGATITLNGTTINRNRPLNFYGLNDGANSTGQGENWDEATLSYSDATGLAAASSGQYALNGDLTPSWIAHTPPSAVGLNTTDPSTDLDSFLAADTDDLVTFVVLLEEVVNGSEDFFFSTKEGGIAPSLSLPNAVPEPSVALLGGLSLLGFLRRRR